LTLLNLGLLGWIVSLVAGFVVGGIYFLSIKVQVDYTLSRKGPDWLVPAALYARILFVAVILVLVAVFLPREKVAGALLAALAGAIVGRVLVSRMVRRSS